MSLTPCGTRESRSRHPAFPVVILRMSSWRAAGSGARSSYHCGRRHAQSPCGAMAGRHSRASPQLFSYTRHRDTYVGLTRWLIPYDTAFAVRVSRPSLRRDRTRVCRDKCRLVRVPAGCAQRGDPGTTRSAHTAVASSRLTDVTSYPLIASPRMIRSRCRSCFVD